MGQTRRRNPVGSEFFQAQLNDENAAAIPGKIEGRKDGCFVGNTKVDCPQSGRQTTAGDKLDLLPPITSLEKRSDPVFFTIILGVIFSLSLLAIFKIKIFGKTLGEYLKPIWYFILVSLVAVASQYLLAGGFEDSLLFLRITQWIWEAMVLASVYKLSKISGFGYANMFFTGLLYSLIIHGTKITIRYLFYAKTFLYLADRFLYGSLLVMAIAFVLGSVFVYLKKGKA